jgi:hypothetical protein
MEMKKYSYGLKKVQCVDGSIGYEDCNFGNGTYRIRIPNKHWPFPEVVTLPRSAFTYCKDQDHMKPSFDNLEEAPF